MADPRIKPIVMPKWGLTMTEGKVTSWRKNPGDAVAVGDEILEVETDKIANVVEASDAGRLRRVLGEFDAVYPVKALIGVLAEDDVSEEEIDAYVASYVTPAAEGGEGEAAAGPQYQFIETATGRIRHAKRGESEEAVLLVHGFGGDLDNWLFNIDALAEVAGQQLPVCVIDEVLQKGAAQPLDQAADCLAVQCQRVDNAADILDDETVEQFDIARSRVDRDMRRGRSVGVGYPVVVAEFRRDPQAGRGQLGEGSERPSGARARPSVSSTCSAAQPSRAPAAARILASRAFAASNTADPPSTVERDANAP